MAMKKRTKRLLIVGPLLLIISVAVVASVTGSSNGGTEVQADLAYRDEISEVVTASGRIQPQTKVDITSEVSAQIIELFCAEGDHVVRGETLVLMDTIQLKEDVAQARYSLDEITARTESARTQFAKNKLELERQSSMFEKGLTSETALTDAGFANENSKANYEAMLAQVKTGRARLAQVQDRLSKTRITAPMDGIITYLNVEVGEIAQAQTAFTQGRTLMTISDLSVFEVDVDVDETEIAKVKLGQQSDIRVDAFEDTTFDGTVVEIGNSALIQGEGTENFSTSFRVKVRFNDTHAAIRPGMSATVDITTATEEEALLIPYAAVVTREFDKDSLESQNGDTLASVDDNSANNENRVNHEKKKRKKIKKSGVFVVKDGLAEFVDVETGIANDRNIVALSGLLPGDTIISGSFQTLRKLSTGDMVTIDDHSLEKMDDDDG
jgi:HlyD family secretion protein